MPDIICPVCGETNTADQEFCQYCQSRLQPFTGPLKGVDAPIQPGQIPTVKRTADLEPILPQWLRDARDEARKSAQEDVEEAAQNIQLSPDASTPDLLAGLQSQSGDVEEDIPDWLANITGAAPKPKKTASVDEVPAPTPTVHRVELGKPDDFLKDVDAGPASASDLPAWLSDTQTVQESGSDDLSAWLHRADEREQPQAEESAPVAESVPGAREAGSTSTHEPVPDWLNNMRKEQPEQSAAELPQAETSLPEVSSDDDWLKNLQAQADMPAWLKEGAAPTSQESALTDVPSWLESPKASEQDNAKFEEPVLGDIPDWLKAAAPQSSFFEETPASAPAQSPDWLSSSQPADVNSVPAFTAETPEENAPTPTFIEPSLPTTNTDELFTELPDWLNAGTEERESAPNVTPAEAGKEDAIAPGELPSWVQAMRPVESSIAQPPVESSENQTPETHGALAGLQGVLPAATDMAPLSKPKAFSIKLNVSNEQQTQAALLEQILTAETAPEPIASFSVLAAQRGLRWFLTGLIFLIVGAALFLHTQIFALPDGMPNEIRDALSAVQAIPENAPVLTVIDYEPALNGEMESAAAPLLDQLILLRQSHLIFISTSPTGGLLAERLVTRLSNGSVADHKGIQYSNLGYLPGGLTGVRAFAQNPRAAVPFDMQRADAWNSAPLQDVTLLSQFAAIIVITDNADSARTWIEQTASARATAPMIVIASAQAAPMIQPYYDSQQIRGMVSGLYGGAIYEQNNAGRPGLARTYWDAYSIGMLLAMALILSGGLWNFALGLRDRAAAEGK